MPAGYFKFLLKEWRSKETQLLVFALLIAISMLTMLGLYSDRIQKTINSNATEFLGGDMVITSPTPIPDNWKNQAKTMQCSYTETVVFPSMASANERLQLANIKAITADYPLYGEILLSTTLQGKTYPAKEIPQPGTVWIDKQFLQLLQIKLNDKIDIGYAKLAATHIITYEPDANPFGLTIAPRIIMNAADLAQTKIIQPGSRIEYRFYLKGAEQNIRQFQRWLKPQLQQNQKLTTIRQDSAELSKTLQKSDAFLHLAAIICIILAGIAIAATTRYFVQRQLSSIALLRCFGLTYRAIFKLFSYYFLLIGIISSILGCMLGYAAQLGLTRILAPALQLKLLAPGLWPLLPSITFGFLILFGFALPALRNLKQIPATWILHQQHINLNTHALLLYFSAAITLLVIIIWYIRDLALIALIISGFGITAAGLYGTAWVLLQLLTPLRRTVGISWRYGLASLVRRAHSSITQIVTFGFIFMVILLQILIRTDLIKSWEAQIPVKAPNIFAINIQPFEVDAFKQALPKLQLNVMHIYPIVRGRLITLNQQPILKAVSASARNENALRRELNLTWTNSLPESNNIVAGHWWTAQDQGKPLVSMEAELAARLGIKPGDRLGFLIGDQTLVATVKSLRQVEWYSFQPNFFMIFPLDVIDKFPATYITSFLVTDKNRLALASLAQQFPSVTFIDVGAILTKIRQIIDQVTAATNYILLFILGTGLIVLNASLLTSHDERLYENAILRSLGARKIHLYLSLAAEFLAIGFLAGLLGLLGALLTSAALAANILKIIPYFNWMLCLAAPFTCALIITVIGLLTTSKLTRLSPLQVIRAI